MKVDRKMLTIGMILFVLYHVLILAIPFAFSTTFFIAWLTTLAMFVIAYVGYHKAFRQGKKLESKLFGFPLFNVACRWACRSFFRWCSWDYPASFPCG